MGRKADKRAARLAAALEREWWATTAQCWVHVGEAIRWQIDPVYRAEVRAERAQFKGQLASPGTALATDEQMPPKNSLQNGKYRVMVPDPASKCAGIWVFDLTEVKVSDPAAVGGKMHRFDATKVPISRWSE